MTNYSLLNTKNMLLPEHKYKVEKVSGMQFTRDNKHQFIEITLLKPAPKDGFGDSFGNDDIFIARAWNKKAENLPVVHAGDIVNAMLALQGRQGVRNDGRGMYNSLNLVVYKMELADSSNN